jgi:hypothetical protein
VVPSGQKLTLGLQPKITLQVVNFRFCTVPSASAIFKSILEVVFITACDSASIVSIVSKRRLFSFIVNQESRENYGWSGTTVMLFFVRKDV